MYLYSFLGRRHICQPLDPTLDICSNFLKKEKKKSDWPPLFCIFLKKIFSSFFFILKSQKPTFSTNSFGLFMSRPNLLFIWANQYILGNLYCLRLGTYVLTSFVILGLLLYFDKTRNVMSFWAVRVSLRALISKFTVTFFVNYLCVLNILIFLKIQGR